MNPGRDLHSDVYFHSSGVYASVKSANHMNSWLLSVQPFPSCKPLLLWTKHYLIPQMLQSPAQSGSDGGVLVIREHYGIGPEKNHC